MIFGKKLAGFLVVSVLVAQPALASNDPYRSIQWAVDLLGVEDAWRKGQGDRVRIAVVDSGVDLTHPDLVDRLLPGKDFVDDDLEPDDEHGHGTLVAGIIAATADNGEGVVGVAPLARIIPVRVLDAEGHGEAGDVADGIDWAVEAGAEVINLSLVQEDEAGGIGLGVFADGRIEDAISRAAQAGVFVAVAAGNNKAGGDSQTSFDASDPSVLVVGASTKSDELAAYSNHGSGLDLLAPGGGKADDPSEGACVAENAIVSSWWNKANKKAEYGAACGTSMATAFVSGVAGLLIDRRLSPSETAERILETTVDLGPKGPDSKHGRGRLDVAAALRVKREEPSPSPSSPPVPPVQVPPVSQNQPSPRETSPPNSATPTPVPSAKQSTPVDGKSTSGADEAITDGADTGRPSAQGPVAAPVGVGVGSARLFAGVLVAAAGLANRSVIRHRRQSSKRII